ncbi:hypothetical protein KC352_g44 [Hortaea werneckii]|nr:hypothetical protein KC352_g44 [Hortaea werneckii]
MSQSSVNVKSTIISVSPVHSDTGANQGSSSRIMIHTVIQHRRFVGRSPDIFQNFLERRLTTSIGRMFTWEYCGACECTRQALRFLVHEYVSWLMASRSAGTIGIPTFKSERYSGELALFALDAKSAASFEVSRCQQLVHWIYKIAGLKQSPASALLHRTRHMMLRWRANVFSLVIGSVISEASSSCGLDELDHASGCKKLLTALAWEKTLDMLPVARLLQGRLAQYIATGTLAHVTLKGIPKRRRKKRKGKFLKPS